jgi:hypothetical protein
MSSTDNSRKGRSKRDKASTPVRGNNDDEMDVDGIKMPPSILKKKTPDGPDPKKAKTGGTPRGRKVQNPRDRSKSKEPMRSKSKEPARSKSKETRARSKSKDTGKTPRTKTPTSSTCTKTPSYADKAKSPPSPKKPLKLGSNFRRIIPSGRGHGI